MSAAQIDSEVSSTDPEVITMESTWQKNGGEPLTLSTIMQAVTKAMSNGECCQDQPEINKFHDSVESIEVAQSIRNKLCTQAVSNLEIFWYLLQLNKDSLFKCELIGSCVAGAVDVVTDVILVFEWYRQGHIWWPSILISMILLSSIVACVLRARFFWRLNAKELVMLFIWLIGLGPCTAIPSLVSGRIRRSAKKETTISKWFSFFKFIGVVFESGPSFILTSYTIAVSLFSDRDAAEVLPITYISLVFSLGSISLTLLTALKSFKPFKISFANQMEGFALNFCDIYFIAISTSLFIAVMGVSHLYIIVCVSIVSVLAKIVEEGYSMNIDWTTF